DRIADRREPELIDRQRNEMRFREERERVSDLADAEPAMLLKRERLKLAIKKNLTECLLVPASGSHECLRSSLSLAGLPTTNAAIPQQSSAKRPCRELLSEGATHAMSPPALAELRTRNPYRAEGE